MATHSQPPLTRRRAWEPPESCRSTVVSDRSDSWSDSVSARRSRSRTRCLSGISANLAAPPVQRSPSVERPPAIGGKGKGTRDPKRSRRQSRKHVVSQRRRKRFEKLKSYNPSTVQYKAFGIWILPIPNFELRNPLVPDSLTGYLGSSGTTVLKGFVFTMLSASPLVAVDG